MKPDRTHQIRTSFTVSFDSNQQINLTLKHGMLCARQSVIGSQLTIVGQNSDTGK